MAHPPPPGPPVWSFPIRLPSLRVIIAAAIIGLIAGGLAASSVLRQRAVYSSRTVMVIDQPLVIAKSGGEGIIVKLNQLRTKYALLARTRQLTKPVSEKTGLPEGLIAGAVNVQLPGPSLLLIVEARSFQPGTARVIADAMAEELIAFVAAEQKNYKIPDDTKIIMTVASPAQPGHKVLPTRDRAMSVGALSGVLALVAVIALFETIGAIRRKR